MGDLSNNFSRGEFACGCGCGSDTIDFELLQVLETLRDNFGGRPVHILSGHRCLKYNREVGSSDTSQHVRGRAVDLWIDGIAAKIVQDYLKAAYLDRYGIGSYGSFTHIDTKTGSPRRW